MPTLPISSVTRKLDHGPCSSNLYCGLSMASFILFFNVKDLQFKDVTMTLRLMVSRLSRSTKE